MMELEVSYSLENAEQFWTGAFNGHTSCSAVFTATNLYPAYLTMIQSSMIFFPRGAQSMS